MNQLIEDFQNFMELYDNIKNEIRRKNKHLYEQWKAGGFLVDDNIVSYYPNLSKVMESFEDDDETDENDQDDRETGN